jgi:capsular polysaccharide biosynthesis protein
VSDRLSHREINVPAGAIQGSTQAGQLHRILTVSVTWADESQLGDIANTVAAILPGEIAKHFAQVGTSGVSASLVDPPAVGMVAASLREKLDLPLRLLLAVVVGVALALVLDYLDDTVRSRQELEESGVNVLAEIPPVQRNGLRFRRPWLP